jgi:hypothetical protein
MNILQKKGKSELFLLSFSLQLVQYQANHGKYGVEGWDFQNSKSLSPVSKKRGDNFLFFVTADNADIFVVFRYYIQLFPKFNWI